MRFIKMEKSYYKEYDFIGYQDSYEKDFYPSLVNMKSEYRTEYIIETFRNSYLK